MLLWYFVEFLLVSPQKLNKFWENGQGSVLLHASYKARVTKCSLWAGSSPGGLGYSAHGPLTSWTTNLCRLDLAAGLIALAAGAPAAVAILLAVLAQHWDPWVNAACLLGPPYLPSKSGFLVSFGDKEWEASSNSVNFLGFNSFTEKASAHWSSHSQEALQSGCSLWDYMT